MDYRVQITRLCRDRERAALFRGWSRLCLHAASLFTAKGTGAARAALTEAIGKKDVLAVENAEVVTGEHQQREVARTSAMAVGLDRETQNTEQVVQEQQKRRVKLLVRGNGMAAAKYILAKSENGSHVFDDGCEFQSISFLSQILNPLFSRQIVFVGGWSLLIPFTPQDNFVGLGSSNSVVVPPPPAPFTLHNFRRI